MTIGWMMWTYLLWWSSRGYRICRSLPRKCSELPKSLPPDYVWGQHLTGIIKCSHGASRMPFWLGFWMSRHCWNTGEWRHNSYPSGAAIKRRNTVNWESNWSGKPTRPAIESWLPDVESSTCHIAVPHCQIVHSRWIDTKMVLHLWIIHSVCIQALLSCMHNANLHISVRFPHKSSMNSSTDGVNGVIYMLNCM
jgi:hypothetical protein